MPVSRRHGNAFAGGDAAARAALIKELVALLPSQTTVVEILRKRSLPIRTQWRPAKCRRLFDCADDFATDDPREPLIQMADIVKVDMKLTALAQRGDLINRFGPWRCRVLAEKVETRLFRDLNWSVFGFRSEIHSVRQVFSIFGERGLRRRVRLVAAVAAGQDKSSDLVFRRWSGRALGS